MAEDAGATIQQENGDVGTADIDWKAEARKWEARSKEKKQLLDSMSDYDDLKAKAARLDEIEASQKSELERATEAASTAQAAASEWQQKFEALQSEQARQREVADKAAQYKVDPGILSRMGGDVEENAQYLAGIEAARPKYGPSHDGGDRQVRASLDERLQSARNESERIRIRAEEIARKRNR